MDRGLEHNKDSKDKSKGSYIRDHITSSHPDLVKELQEGTRDLFSMQLIKPARFALSRQLRKAVEIAANTTGGIILNSNDEFSRCLIPCLQVEGPKQQKHTKDKKDDKQNTTEIDESTALKNKEKKKNKFTGHQVFL